MFEIQKKKLKIIDQCILISAFNICFLCLHLVGVVFVVTSCGQIPTPKNGRKSTFHFTPGTMVQFDCDPGYVLLGEQRRWCYITGYWNFPEDGEAECMCKFKHLTKEIYVILKCLRFTPFRSIGHV